MLDSTSQWNLLADCAKDWGFYSESCLESEDEKPQILVQEDEDWQERDFYSETNLIHYAHLTEQEEKTLLQGLMANPANAILWQLCLMGYSKENRVSLEESLENPLEGFDAWLLEGVKKGWLRKKQQIYSLDVLDYSLFLQRLQKDCQNSSQAFTLALVKIQTSDYMHEVLMQNFAKFLGQDDYLSKIKGLGYAIVLSGRKNFAASAVMEKISDAFEQVLHRENIIVDFSVGLSEFCAPENADSLIDRAKHALSMSSPTGMKVKSYIKQQKNTEKNSLVQSNEKRFLFFGVE